MHLSRIFRHPIKALGHEALAEVILEAGKRLPGDRLWAVAHEAARLGADGDWARCSNFIRGAKSSQLMAISAASGPDGITLSHPDRPTQTFDPATEGAALVEWVLPICDTARAAPVRVVPAPGGMTDNDQPWLSLLSHASRESLGEAVGKALSPLRFRGNLWIEGAEPWAELGWIGRQIEIGDALLEVKEPIERCVATHVDPDTGEPDTNLLNALETGWGHRDFGVFVEVVRTGRIAPGDPVTLS